MLTAKFFVTQANDLWCIGVCVYLFRSNHVQVESCFLDRSGQSVHIVLDRLSLDRLEINGFRSFCNGNLFATINDFVGQSQGTSNLGSPGYLCDVNGITSGTGSLGVPGGSNKL